MFLGFEDGWCYYRYRELSARCESTCEGDHAMIPAMWEVKRCTWS
jgi:hypothetical protein